MSNFLHWCAANKALLLTIAGFAISEILPFTSGKWNGLLQGLSTLISKQEEPKK